MQGGKMSGVAELDARSIQPDIARLIQSRWVWCIVAAGFCMLRGLGQDPGGLLNSLGDTDDATRMVQVREFMAGASWFDTTLGRFGGAAPLVSHWSRLIDLPIALLLLMLQLFFTVPTAELLVRILWPTLLMVLFFRLLVREVEMHANARTAVLFLLIAVSCFGGLAQFKAGRIDHHNVMILGAVVGALALLRIKQDARGSVEAGALLAISVAVGYEALALVVPLLAAVGCAALARPELRFQLARFGQTFAAVVAVVFVLTVGPTQWFQVHCDALSLNAVVLAISGATGLTLISRGQPQLALWRAIAIMGAPVAVGLVIYGMLEPKCLAGPFGEINPGIKGIWLDQVQEGFSLFRMGVAHPMLAVLFGVSQLMGIAAALYLLMRGEGQQIFRIGLVVLIAVATLGAVWQVKLIPYAAWFAVIAVATLIGQLRGTAQLSVLSVQILAVLLVSQSVIGLGATAVLKIAGASKNVLEGKMAGDTAICRSTKAVSTLKALKPGLVVAPIDIGPFAVALTPHRVLAAPYHRMGLDIITLDQIMTAEPASAEQRLRDIGADYLVLCVPDSAANTDGALQLSGLGLERVMLSGGRVPYLEAVTLPTEAKALRVWKVLPKA